MATKMCDCNQGRLACSGCRIKVTKFPEESDSSYKIRALEVSRSGQFRSVEFDPPILIASGGPQATKFTRQEMRERSPSGTVYMDSMMGKNFTTWFLIKCGLVGVAAAYAFDWAIMSMPAWQL